MKKQTLVSGIALSLGVGVLGGSSAFAKPVNTNFDDDEFYQCVVDTYHGVITYPVPMDAGDGGEGGDSTGGGDGSNPAIGIVAPNYTTENLTDEQLASITYLTCGTSNSYQNRPHNLKGIEKLTNLETLWLLSGEVTDADLSKNTKLTNIGINKNPLETLKLPASTKKLDLGHNSGAPVKIDMSQAVNIEELGIYYTAVDNPFDTSKLTKLSTITLNSTGIKRIDLRNAKDVLISGATTEPIIDADVTYANFPGQENADKNAKPTIDISRILRDDTISNRVVLFNGKEVTGGDYFTYDPATKLIAITDLSKFTDGYITLAGLKIALPEIPTEADPGEEKKDNPNTSTASKLILGFSFLGAAAVAMAIKAVIKARAKRA